MIKVILAFRAVGDQQATHILRGDNAAGAKLQATSRAEPSLGEEGR